MRRAVIGMVGLFFSGLFPGCGESGGRSDEGENSPAIRTASQGLSSDPRTRVVQEASYAMTGDWYRYTKANWPDTGDRYAAHTYSSSDLSAWNLLLSNYGQMASCKGSWGTYSPCSLSYGANQMPWYTCQGYCPGAMRGGQCKAFANLIAYRSGAYRGSGGSFKSFPLDSSIKSMASATYEKIQPGDFLRLPADLGSPHALIVVRKNDATRKVVVFDSNWIGGSGSEVVGSHVLDFSGSGYYNLGNYKILNCVYDGNC